MRKIKSAEEIEKNTYTSTEVLNLSIKTLKRLRKSGNLKITPELFAKYMLTLMQIHTKKEIGKMVKNKSYDKYEKYKLIKNLKIPFINAIEYAIVALDWLKQLNTSSLSIYIYCLIELMYWHKPTEIRNIVERISKE